MTALLLDLGLGNLHSVERGIARALQLAGGEGAGALGASGVQRTSDVSLLARAQRIVLPGVGAFADGMRKARAAGLKSAIEDALARGARVLGICLGMQMLFEVGEEGGEQPGLGLLRGRVRRLPAGVMVPHMGWRRVEPARPSALLGTRPSWFYFAHSYACEAAPEDAAAIVEHGRPFAAAVERGGLWGVQFHPEKSQRAGEALLARFLT